MGFKEKLQKNSHISREKKLWQEAEKIHGELYISLWQIAAHGGCNFLRSNQGKVQQKPPFKRDIE